MTDPPTITLARLEAALGEGLQAHPPITAGQPPASAWRAAEWRIVGLFVGQSLCPQDPLRGAAEFRAQAPTDANRLALAARVQGAFPRPETNERAALDYLTGAALQWALTVVAQRGVRLAPFPGGDLAAALRWLDTLEHALEQALTRDRMVRVPQPVLSSVLACRAGQIHAEPSRERRTPQDPSGRTFAAVLPDVRHWRIAPAHHPALALPVAPGASVTTRTAGARARQVLTGGVIKLYLATWALWAEGGQDDGLFAWDPTHVLLDIYNLKPVTNTSKGRQYKRPRSERMAELKRDFATLCSTWLLGIGDIACEPAQPLVYVYRQTHHHEAIYQHAPLAWMAMKRAFVQVPRPVLHLPAFGVPLALGLAALWRRHITTTVLRGPGYYSTTLRALATDLGEDWEAGTRQEGHAYWRYFSERFTRIAAASDLGTMQVAGDGPDAQVHLEPGEVLATVYRPLAEAADQHHARAAIYDTEPLSKKDMASEKPLVRANREKSRR